MTLLEFFTESHIDNIAACLRLRPESMIIVGDIDKMRTPVKRYRQLLKQRKQRTEITMCDVQGKDLGQTRKVLNRLVQSDEQMVIDLTGGDETALLAVGAALAELDADNLQRIRVEKFDHEHGVVIDCLNGNRSFTAKTITLTVEELISLHGGSIHSSTYQPPADCRCSELDGLWDIVSHSPHSWNKSITHLNEFESRSGFKTRIHLPLGHLRQDIHDFAEKEQAVRDLLDKLEKAGVIYNNSTDSLLDYTYRSAMLRYCTLKAGNALEIKTLLEGRSALENGRPMFHSCQTSVNIDWGGEAYDPEKDIAETSNEIDAVLMHGSTALFVSCKNGTIDEEELYKLHTVATRFGGPYAKKMLIATELDRRSIRAYQAFTQRAWDMDIFLVPDAAELSPEEWPQVFMKAMV